MKININNYNAIKSLDYSIQEGKINYLFGISGCGKSSIAYALTNDDCSNHIPYGENDLKPTITVDGNPTPYDKFKMFDFDYMHNILINKANGEDIYNILVGDGGDIEKLRDEYNSIIKDLIDKKGTIYEIEGKISTLINDLKVNYKKDNTYVSTCLIGKLTKNIEKEKISYVKNKGLSSSQIKWFSDGTKTVEYSNGKCPFCNKKLSDSKKQQIEKLMIFDAKTFEKVNAKSNIFKDLSIMEPNWIKKREVERFNKQINEYFLLLPQFKKIIEFISIAQNFNIVVGNLQPLKVSKEMVKYFPDIADCIEDFNENYTLIKRKLIEIRKSTDKLLSGNLKQINDYLDLLGIQYKFCKTKINETDKKAEFIIKSIKDKKEVDRVENLSFGEKNIIGMVLFLIANKDYSFLIIDDPASSFDEYRRKVIFDTLYKMKTESSTLLVLSHDHVFAKYAIYHYEASKKEAKSNLEKLYLKYTGNIDYIETYSDTKIVPIESTDFKPMTEFIKEHISNLGNKMNYRVAINLRLYYEINKPKKYKKAVYGYLSAILHKCPVDTIAEYLEKENRTEEEVLSIISQDFDVLFSKINEQYCDDIKIEDFNNFEKLIYSREMCNKTNRAKIVKDELSNVIHMNMAYAICLNPYRFNYYSRYVYNYLINELKVSIA